MVDLAKDHGVELWEGSHVSNFKWRDEKKGEWKILIKNDKIQSVTTPLIIGADGVLGIVRRLARLKKLTQRLDKRES